MLNADALQQLSQLKKTIQDSKDYAEGTVRGTANRFGFVMLDDGREAFLPPEEMQQVLPGDRVKVSLTENDKKKHEAKLEKLLGTELKTFTGEYLEKGNNHFVSADHPQLARWFFVPPKQRKGCRSGDLVSCQIVRHPFGDGKAQTKIVARIGRLDEAGIERQYIIHKHGLVHEWSQDAQQETQAIQALVAETAAPLDKTGREDLTALGFVTIDAESTQDMDDALYLEAQDDGWLLYTAIADPAAFVPAGSALDRAARQRASSIYFPGHALPMFPNELSQNIFSLLAGEERLVLVCKQRISASGEILDFSFGNAVIRSRYKLSYNQVADCLANGNHAAVPDDCVELLGHLHTLATARKRYRYENHIVQDNNVDYVFRLNKQQKIEKVERRQPTLAHQIVEEAMLATNCCAGHYFAQAAERLGRASGGLFSSHAGFRPERLAEIEQLLKKDKPDMEPLELTALESYCQLMRTLQGNDADAVLLATFKRRLQPASISTEAAAHFGLGFEYYATITSPIRRYQDLHNHRVIKGLLAAQVLAGETPTRQALAEQTLTRQTSSTADISVAESVVEPSSAEPFSAEPTSAEPSVAEHSVAEPSFVDQLQAQIIRNRQACRQVEQWLLCQFLADKQGEIFEATVTSVASQGIAVRLTDTGAGGFIPIRGNKKNPPKYDSLRMTLAHGDTTYHLEQVLRVKLDKVDLTSKQLQLSVNQAEMASRC
jgi:exoribonuclease II